ncbi:MAG TPA: MFS transporter [Thermohalobaculum sp.]|nr:MFS transporter [Thermohalobaculum sp.]
MIDPQVDDARARRAVPFLLWAQAVLGAQMTVHFILGGLAGSLLAENKALATLPITMIVLGAMLLAPVMSWLMGRWGRRTGFLIGATAGASGGALAAQALVEGSFVLLLIACLITGIYMAGQNFYRFAAADLASRDYRPKAISWVMVGGLIAAVIGPELVIWFKDSMAPIPFAGAYRAMIVLNLVGAIPLIFLDIPLQPRGPLDQRQGRPWREILAQRRIVVAILCAMVSFSLMSLVMTSTPLAMVHHGFGTDAAAGVVRVHVLAMYAPSFVTGLLIARYRSPRIIAVGLALLAAGALVALSGMEMFNFNVALTLIGVGWNFGFIGATTMLAGAHLPEERARVQGLNDFLVMGMVTLASGSSGALMAQLGWQAVNLAVIPLLVLASVALILLTLSERTVRP